MYLWAHTFMRPVFQGVKQVREPAVHLLTRRKHIQNPIFHSNYGYHIRFQIEFWGQI